MYSWKYININVVQYPGDGLNNSCLVKGSTPILLRFLEDNCALLKMWKYNVYCQILPNPCHKTARISGMIAMIVYQKCVPIYPSKWLHSCDDFHVRLRQCIPEHHPSNKAYIGKGCFETSNPSQCFFVEPNSDRCWSHYFFLKEPVTASSQLKQ